MVEFVLQQKKRVLWVGSAGMANALFSALNPGYPVLGIVGSISETSRGQVRVAVEAGAKLVELNVADLIRGGSIAPVAEEVVERLKLGQDVIVVSAKEQADYLDAVDAGKKSGMTRQEVAQFTQKKLGELSVEILKRAKV